MTASALSTAFSVSELDLDRAAETDRIVEAIRDQVLCWLRRKGVVLGLSGGIDSSVTAALCVRALGAHCVLGLLMPERDSSDDSLRLGRLLADDLGIETVFEGISETLEGTGCYRRRDQALRTVFPQYRAECHWKIVLPSLFSDTRYRLFSAVIELPGGEVLRKRLPLDVYQEIVAATNFKQRVRKMMEYYHADRLRYAVAGTPNLLEYDQGFFVKNGDGSADLKPIGHLYKTQVYQLAEFLEIPAEICQRTPTTDTYSLEQTQEEFFFSLPYDQMDACLFGKNHEISSVEVAEAIGLSEDQVERVYRDIDAKRRAARYLHEKPLMATKPSPLEFGYV